MTILVGLPDVALVTDSAGVFALAPGVPIVDTAPATQTLVAGFLTDSDSVYAPLIVWYLFPALYSDVDGFFAPTVVAAAGALAPALFGDVDTFYVPLVAGGAVSLLPALVADGDLIYAPAVALGAVTLLPALVSDAEAIYAASVTAAPAGALVPAFIVDADTVYAPSIRNVTQTLQPPLLVDFDGFFVILVTTIGTLLPGRVADFDSIYSATIGQDRFLRPSLVPNDDIIYPAFSIAAAQLPKTQTLKPPPKIQDLDVIYAARLSLSPLLVVDADVIYATITQWVNTLLPALVPSDDVVRAPSVAPIVQPGLVQDADAVYAPRLTLFLLPARVADADVIPAADVGWKVFSKFVDSDDQIFSVVLHTFNGLLPDVYVEDDFIDTYPFFVHGLSGGVPVPRPPGVLVGSVDNRRRLKGSVNVRPTLIGSVERKTKVLKGSVRR